MLRERGKADRDFELGCLGKESGVLLAKTKTEKTGGWREGRGGF